MFCDYIFNIFNPFLVTNVAVYFCSSVLMSRFYPVQVVFILKILLFPCNVRLENDITLGLE